MSAQGAIAVVAAVLAASALVALGIERLGVPAVGRPAVMRQAVSADTFACDPTRTTTWSPSNHFFAGPISVVVGGDLASDPWRALRVGQYWYLRDQAPRRSITLLAERLDRAAQPIEFEAIGNPLGPGLPREWTAASHFPVLEILPNPLVHPGTGGWYYRTGVKALEILPQEGCWRVSWVDGDAGDSIVHRVVPQPRMRSKWGP